MAFQSWAFGDGQSGFGGDAYLLDGSYLDSACYIGKDHKDVFFLLVEWVKG